MEIEELRSEKQEREEHAQKAASYIEKEAVEEEAAKQSATYREAGPLREPQHPPRDLNHRSREQ